MKKIIIATEIRTVTHFFCFKDNFNFLEIMANDSNKSKRTSSLPHHTFFMFVVPNKQPNIMLRIKRTTINTDKNTEENQKNTCQFEEHCHIGKTTPNKTR